jgi:hypothetical protein
MYEYLADTYEDRPNWKGSEEGRVKKENASDYISGVGPKFFKNVKSRMKKPEAEVAV